MQKLNINFIILKDIANFTTKIRNVTQLEIAIYLHDGYDTQLPNDTRLIYQQFFNQITKLTLKLGVVDSDSWPPSPWPYGYRQRSEQFHLISNFLMCENLNSICIRRLQWLETLTQRTFLAFLHAKQKSASNGSRQQYSILQRVKSV